MAFRTSRAQSPSGNRAYSIQEYVLLPSKVKEYEKTLKEFMDIIKKYNILDAKWITTQTNDFRYLFVQPIPNMAELDNNKFWVVLREKMGADNLTDLFSRMDKYYVFTMITLLRLTKIFRICLVVLRKPLPDSNTAGLIIYMLTLKMQAISPKA
jgi:hypothetical protein